jgi:DNA-binding CsgD family transcriptional regulator
VARGASVVGRDAELGVLEGAFTAGPDHPAGAAVILVGGPGIGKTTLWEAAADLARAQGMHVLAARPSGSELRLTFAGLIDLCDGLGADLLAELPTPQRTALEAALLRAEPMGARIDQTAIALGFLGAVRTLATRGRVVIAVDDLQSLDPPSDEVLAFAAHRLGDAEVAFLLARRPGRAGALERLLSRGGMGRLPVGPLSLGAVRRLLFERLELTVSRQLLRRIMEATAGNPLFALEIGRSLREQGAPALEADVPLPDSVEEMLGVRIARLSAPVRRVLLAVSLSEHPSVDDLIAITDPGALDDAVDAGVVVIDGPRVRASHPLLAAVAQKRSRARDRRELHLALAEVAGDEQMRAMHLALAATREDRVLAGRLAAAAEDARARGARRAAVSLAAQALRLTPAIAPERPERVLALAERLDDAGEIPRLTDLLKSELDSLPPGSARAHAWLLLSEGADVTSIQEHDEYLERAMGECATDRHLRANVLAKRSSNAAAAAIAQLDKAEEWALEALGDADEPGVERCALYALAWARAMTGRPIDDLCERSGVADDPSAYLSASAERVAGKRLMWRGELEAARALFSSLSALADERGERTSYAMLRLHLCELEMRAGNWGAAGALLDEWAQSSDYETQFRPQYHRCRALLAAGVGEAEEAERWATEAIERAQAATILWDELEARRARGIAALLTLAPKRAVAHMRPVWGHCERERVLDPGVFPVAPELVEALAELGELTEARTVAERLSELGTAQAHPWALANAKRAGAIVTLAAGPYDESSAATLRDAADELGRLEMPFDRARCLLALGRLQRRAKQWRAARDTLEAAVAGFGALGSEGWAGRARSELERVGGRQRGSGELTPSERRVAELAADGLANKEIAATLYVTVNTVEVHLARVYAKLGVRSRAQLGSRLAR